MTTICPFEALFPILVLRAGPGFCLRQFLVIAYLLLFHKKNHVQTAREFHDLNMDFVV